MEKGIFSEYDEYIEYKKYIDEYTWTGKWQSAS